jgi:hypothetical protein
MPEWLFNGLMDNFDNGLLRQGNLGALSPTLFRFLDQSRELGCTHLPNDEAARNHADRIVRELKEGGYDPPDSTLVVQDEMGNTIDSIPF